VSETTELRIRVSEEADFVNGGNESLDHDDGVEAIHSPCEGDDRLERSASREDSVREGVVNERDGLDLIAAERPLHWSRYLRS
jgi:hypothetical protein